MFRYLKAYVVLFIIHTATVANTPPSQNEQCHATLHTWAINSHREFWTLIGKMAGYEARNEATYQYVKSPNIAGLNYVYIDKTNTDPDYVFNLMKDRAFSIFFQADNDDHMFKYITVLNQSNDYVTMGMDLNTLAASYPIPAHIKVWKVTTDAQFNEWLQTTVSRRSPKEEATIREYFQAFLPSKNKNTSIAFYLGSINGKIVGSSLMYYSQDFVSLYWVGVHPDYRRQGLGSILSYVPLKDAKQKGYRWSVLQAQPLGVPIYPKLGFQKVGLLKAFYYLPPKY
jgi:ribosomal protein S18 acetylase RimI-like enzyme